MTLGRRIANLEAAIRRRNEGMKPRILVRCEADGEWWLDGVLIGEAKAQELMREDHPGMLIIRMLDTIEPLPGAIIIERSYGRSDH